MYKKKLLEINIPAHLDGFRYINRALEIYYEDMKITALYSQLADEFDVKPSRIEKGIRHALTNAMIDSTSNTNGAFIANYKLVYWADVQKEEVAV